MSVDVERRGEPPISAPALGAAGAVRVELVAEDRHGELVTRRMALEPGLEAFEALLSDLRYCGYRGLVLRRVGP